MLVLVEDAAEKRNAQKAMEMSITAHLARVGKRNIGFPSGNVDEVLYSNGNGTLWAAFSNASDASVPRRWNAFGVYEDSRPAQMITVEISPKRISRHWMAKLTARDTIFVEKHGIAVASLFDASGMPTWQWKDRMRAEGKLFAFGVRCLRGHSLKSRSGNCIRCNTANITFQLRASRPGFVYIARSAMTKLTKVGFSANDVQNRVYIANLEGYATATDWRVVEEVFSIAAGRLEIEVHKALRERRRPQAWVRNGWECEAHGVYRCTLGEARKALIAAQSHFN